LPLEAENMRFVAQYTSVRIPKVHRSFNIASGLGYFRTTGYIVMDYVEGDCLPNYWNDLLERQEVVVND
jgi:hypothetical protein